MTRARLLLVLAGLVAGCPGDRPAESPTSTVLGEAPGIVNAVAIDGEFLYAVGYHPTNGGFVVRVAAKGGALESLATEKGAAKSVAVHDGRVYWDDGFAITRAAVAGGPTENVLAEGRADVAMAVDDAHVYFVSSMRAQSGTPQLVRVASNGGAPEVVVGDAVGTPLAIADDWVYWASSDGVARVSTKGGAAETLASIEARRVSVDGDYVYFCGPSFVLHRVPKDGGADETLDAGCGDGLLVLDGVSYWTDKTYGEGATHLSVGVVWRQAPGRAREELYRGDLVSNLAAADGQLYFGAGTKLLRLPI